MITEMEEEHERSINSTVFGSLAGRCCRAERRFFSDNLMQWDSLAAMNLVVAIEEKFRVQLSTKEIMKMSTIACAQNSANQEGDDMTTYDPKSIWRQYLAQ